MRRLGVWSAAVLLTVSASACRRVTRPPPPHSDFTEARRLRALSDDYTESLLRRNPIWATYLADRRYDFELQDLSLEAQERMLEETRVLREDVADLDPDKLAEEDRVTRDTLLSVLDATLAESICREELWDVNALDGIQAALAELPQLHPVETLEQARALEVRYLKTPVLLDRHIDNLRLGMKKGYLSARVSVQRTLEQLEEMLARPVEGSPFLTRVHLPSNWRDDEKQRVRRKLADAVRSAVLPALRRYRGFLETEYLPLAREAVGVGHNPEGEACYQAKIRSLTGVELTADEIHTLGLQEVQRLDAEMKLIAQQVVGTPDLEKLKRHLASSAKQRPKSREELVRFAEGVLSRATAALPKAFGRLSSRKVELRQVEELRERSAPAGFYFEGDEAGTRPGYFYLNTSAPETRPLYQLEPLTFHEAVPGHHLQISLAQDLRRIPRFRRLIGHTAFLEGWGLYAEKLADELGLYSGPEARFGMLSYQALRAARLVVDTGIHIKGWTREQAIQFVLDHTAEPSEEAAREIDRYIVWPGQALAYKLGEREILSLRSEAQAALGERFDIRAFHDTVLGNGAVPLPVLRNIVETWVERERRKLPAQPGARGNAR